MPRFSIITPVYRPEAEDLQTTIDSVRAQTFADWEWILVDDASREPEVTAVLLEAEGADPRIRVVERPENGHIVAASNDGIALACGEWIALLDHDDLLVPTALEKVAAAIDAHPKAGYVYTDEDKIHADGSLTDTNRKPDWAPELLRHMMYVGHLSVLRADLVREAGGFHAGFDGSQDHDLALRVTELADEVVHVPEVLYHWRIRPGSAAGDTGAKDYSTLAGIRAVQEHLDRQGLPWKAIQAFARGAEGQIIPLPHMYDIERTCPTGTRISVIVPTRGTRALVFGQWRSMVVEMARSLRERSEGVDVEFVAVYDSGMDESILRELRSIWGPHLTEVEYSKPFNFSDKCNVGFLAASGDILVFMNDDMQIISEDFLARLCAPVACESDVGATGARLLHSDGTIQHAGLAQNGYEYNHVYRGASNFEYGYFGELLVDHEVTALTGACLAVRRDVYEEAGGFSLLFPGSFNDVDLCEKIRHLGYRLVWMHDVRAWHFESMSREPQVNQEELDLIEGRWSWRGRDPYMPWAADAYIQKRMNGIGTEAPLLTDAAESTLKAAAAIGEGAAGAGLAMLAARLLR